MKAFLVYFAFLTGLIGCQQSSINLLYQDLNECEQVAERKQINDNKIIVCNFDLLKDTIILPLSYFTESLHIVKLDDNAEISVPGGDVIVGEHHILIPGSYWLGKIPYLLFDKSGKFITNIGSYGRGPGEYFDVFDQQMDEKNDRIYLLPWRSDKILVYNLKGNHLDPIRLSERIHIGRFCVNQEDSVVSIFAAPVNDYRVTKIKTEYFIWSQNMSGKILNGLPLSPEYLPIFDMSRFEANDPASSGNTKEQDVYYTKNLNPCQDTLYHYNPQSNLLIPQFTVNFKNRKIPLHYFGELPNHYIGYIGELREVAYRSFETFNYKTFIVEKNSLKGAYIKIENDFLGNMDVIDPSSFFYRGYYARNYEPAALFECLENTLANKTMTNAMQKKLTNLKNSIKETDNNYVLYAKLKE